MPLNWLKTRLFYVSFGTEITDESIPLANCKNYKYASDYNECDDNFLHTQLKKINLHIPAIWISTMFYPNQSNRVHVNTPIDDNMISNLMNGISYSSCLRPCSISKAKAK